MKGVAKDWFEGLDPKSVDSFKTLGWLFLTQFLAMQKRRKNSAYMLCLQQGKDESLKDYMLRFNWEELTMEKVNDEMVLSAFMKGIKVEGPLMAKLAQKKKLVTLP